MLLVVFISIISSCLLVIILFSCLFPCSFLIVFISGHVLLLFPLCFILVYFFIFLPFFSDVFFFSGSCLRVCLCWDSACVGSPRLSLGSPSSDMLLNKPNTVNLLRPQSASKRRRCSRISTLFVGCNLPPPLREPEHIPTDFTLIWSFFTHFGRRAAKCL